MKLGIGQRTENSMEQYITTPKKRLSTTGWLTILAILTVALLTAYFAFSFINQPKPRQAATSAENSHDLTEFSGFIDQSASESMKSELAKQTDTPWEYFVIRKGSYQKTSDKYALKIVNTQDALVYNLTAHKISDGSYGSTLFCAAASEQIGGRVCTQDFNGSQD